MNDSKKECFFYLLAVMCAVIAVVGIAWHASDCDDSTGEGKSRLISVDTIRVTHAASRERLVELREYLLNMNNLAVQGDLTREEIKWQARIFYATIVAALLGASLIFSKDDREKRNGGVAIAAVAVLMFWLDVHLNDLIVRYGDVRMSIDSTIAAARNITPGDSSWYGLAPFPEVKGKFSERASRKFCDAIRPNFEQVIFYMIPLAFAFVRIGLTYRRGLCTERAP